MEPDLRARLIDGMSKYPNRLHHDVPGWIKNDAIYHIRIRTDQKFPRSLTDPTLAPVLLKSVASYHERERWHCFLFLLMPDHIHAVLSFPVQQKMGNIVGAWKAFHAKQSGILWQSNFFDHRIRSGGEFDAKVAYIRHSPVVKGLCENEEGWPWVHVGSL